VLDALGYWLTLAHREPTRAMIGAAASYAPGSGNFGNILGALNRKGLICYPRPGAAALTDDGLRIARTKGWTGTPLERAESILSGPQFTVLQAVARIGEASREEIAQTTGYAPGSGNFGNLLGALRTLTMIDYPAKGRVRIAEWLR
jgi:uncharacterized protein